MPITIPLSEHLEDNFLEKYFIDETEITIEMLYQGMAKLQTELNSLKKEFQTHVENDAGLYQRMASDARQQAIDIYKGLQPALSPNGIEIASTEVGLLVLPQGNDYSVQENGGITISFSAVLALGSLQVKVNDNVVFDTALLSLLSLPAPTTIRVNGGDTVSIVGNIGLLSSLSVVFYPNIDLE